MEWDLPLTEQSLPGCPCPHWVQPRALLWTRALTAIVFSLIPPTGRIFPVNDTSPVMATFCLTGQFMARDSRAVTMVHPALGPSFGVAPCLKKTKHNSPAHSRSSRVRQYSCPCCFNIFQISWSLIKFFACVCDGILLFELADKLTTVTFFTLFMRNNPQMSSQMWFLAWCHHHTQWAQVFE